MGGSAVVGVSKGSAALSFAIPAWLNDIGSLGLSAIIGGTVVAAVNHFLTNRRERGAWLREQQVRVHAQFAKALAEMADYVAEGPPAKALDDPYFRGLNEAAQGVAPLAMSLVNKFFELSLVAEHYTLEVAKKVSFSMCWPRCRTHATGMGGAIR